MKTAPARPQRAARERMIAEAAYYIAERRGFAPGSALDDWLAAEAEIDRHLAALERNDRILRELDEMAEASVRLAKYASGSNRTP